MAFVEYLIDKFCRYDISSSHMLTIFVKFDRLIFDRCQL